MKKIILLVIAVLGLLFAVQSMIFCSQKHRALFAPVTETAPGIAAAEPKVQASLALPQTKALIKAKLPPRKALAQRDQNKPASPLTVVPESGTLKELSQSHKMAQLATEYDTIRKSLGAINARFKRAQRISVDNDYEKSMKAINEKFRLNPYKPKLKTVPASVSLNTMQDLLMDWRLFEAEFNGAQKAVEANVYNAHNYIAKSMKATNALTVKIAPIVQTLFPAQSAS